MGQHLAWQQYIARQGAEIIADNTATPQYVRKTFSLLISSLLFLYLFLYRTSQINIMLYNYIFLIDLQDRYYGGREGGRELYNTWRTLTLELINRRNIYVYYLVKIFWLLQGETIFFCFVFKTYFCFIQLFIQKYP